MVLEALWEGAPRRTFKESKNPLPISKSLQIRVIHPDTHLVTHTPTHTTHTPSRPLGSATHPHVSVTSIMSPKRWQNHRPPWKKKTLSSRGQRARRWCVRKPQGSSSVLRRDPSGDACGALDLINHISCMYFLSHTRAKYTVPHHKHPRLCHSHLSLGSKHGAKTRNR